MRTVWNLIRTIAAVPLLLLCWMAGAIGVIWHEFKRQSWPVVLALVTVFGVLIVANAGAPTYTPGPVASAAPSGSAGGDLTGTYPNPTIKASVSLTTPVLGAATATTLNGNTFTTGSGTLTLGAGKTTTFDHTSTFTTTDGQTYTFPATSATVARTDAGQTFTGVQVFTSPTIGTSCSLIGDTVNATIQHLTENTQTGAGYTLVLGDDYKVITVNTAGANTLSIPTNASVAFPVGTQITVIQKGAGQWTISAANSGTTTIVSNGGTAASPKLRVQYSAATLWKDATDHWYVFGDIQ